MTLTCKFQQHTVTAFLEYGSWILCVTNTRRFDIMQIRNIVSYKLVCCISRVRWYNYLSIDFFEVLKWNSNAQTSILDIYIHVHMQLCGIYISQHITATMFSKGMTIHQGFAIISMNRNLSIELCSIKLSEHAMQQKMVWRRISSPRMHEAPRSSLRVHAWALSSNHNAKQLILIRCKHSQRGASCEDWKSALRESCV